MQSFAILIPAVIAIAVITRLVAGSMDQDRISNHVKSIGGRILECTWSPLGPGWFGDNDNRIYLVRYVDKDGDTHMAYCKTSFWSGVYFTRDKIVETNEKDKPETLAEENQRLRKELERLKQDKGQP